ncbi:MAG TPA: MFS transporter [Actinospica sp.]|jgi:MFS family permease|nr:MFS transporter [Actinospica sp.]
MPDPARLRRARLGVSGIFFLLGFTLAAWATNLPTLQQRTGASSAVIGLAILVMGAGTVAGAQACGVLVDRVGARAITAAGVVVLLCAVNLLPAAHNGWSLALIAALQGAGSGCADVAMNNQAAVVERGYGRPIMSGFHALFSVGGAAGAGFAAILQSAGLSYPLILAAFSSACALIAAVALPAMLPGRAPTTQAQRHAATGGALPKIGRSVVLLGALAFALMLSEGVAGNWGALEAVDRLHRSHAAASLAYGVFATCMTIGRLLVDRVSVAIGPVRTVRIGGAVAAAGVLLVVVSEFYPLTLLGWAVFGIGLAGGVPQVFTAAGNLPSAKPGAAMARVVGVGYVGEMGGPAVIGGVASLVGIAAAFLIPFALCLASIGLAFGVGRREPPTLDTSAGTETRGALV